MKNSNKWEHSVTGDVDMYLASIPKQMSALLQRLRLAIRDAAPEAEETISYRIPTYKYHGTLLHFVARDNYCSFIVTSAAILEKFKKEPGPFKISGTTIHFTAEKPIPAKLVKKNVRARVDQSEAERMVKEKKRVHSK